MTMDERVEAAARAGLAHRGLDWDITTPEWRKEFQTQFSVALAAAFPELHGDKPTHWLAPMEATEDMRDAMADQMGSRAEWGAARDAYLGKGDGG
jgi:hypothetical protein